MGVGVSMYVSMIVDVYEFNCRCMCMNACVSVIVCTMYTVHT